MLFRSGLSGGIDSALVACLAVDALGSENVSLISMPSRFSSDHSKSDAKQLAKNLDANFKTVDIDSLFQAYLDVMNVLDSRLGLPNHRWQDTLEPEGAAPLNLDIKLPKQRSPT